MTNTNSKSSVLPQIRPQESILFIMALHANENNRDLLLHALQTDEKISLPAQRIIRFLLNEPIQGRLQDKEKVLAQKLAKLSGRTLNAPRYQA